MNQRPRSAAGERQKADWAFIPTQSESLGMSEWRSAEKSRTLAFYFSFLYRTFVIASRRSCF